MVEESAENCWEFWNCGEHLKKVCPVFQNKKGRECWLHCSHEVNQYGDCPKNSQHIEGCWDCAWFKKLNPNFERK